MYEFSSTHLDAGLSIQGPSGVIATETEITLYDLVDAMGGAVAIRIDDASDFCAEVISIVWEAHPTSEDRILFSASPRGCRHPDYGAFAAIDTPFVIATIVPERASGEMLLLGIALVGWLGGLRAHNMSAVLATE